MFVRRSSRRLVFSLLVVSIGLMSVVQAAWGSGIRSIVGIKFGLIVALLLNSIEHEYPKQVNTLRDKDDNDWEKSKVKLINEELKCLEKTKTDTTTPLSDSETALNHQTTTNNNNNNNHNNNNNPQSNNQNNNNNNNNNNNSSTHIQSKPTCFYCGLDGHYYNFCKLRRWDQQSNINRKSMPIEEQKRRVKPWYSKGIRNNNNNNNQNNNNNNNFNTNNPTNNKNNNINNNNNNNNTNNNNNWNNHNQQYSNNNYNQTQNSPTRTYQRPHWQTSNPITYQQSNTTLVPVTYQLSAHTQFAMPTPPPGYQYQIPTEIMSYHQEPPPYWNYYQGGFDEQAQMVTTSSTNQQNSEPKQFQPDNTWQPIKHLFNSQNNKSVEK